MRRSAVHAAVLPALLDQVAGANGRVLLGRENARKKDVRLTNIEAAKAVADVIRTSLGPRGMDKMVRTRRLLVGALPSMPGLWQCSLHAAC